MPLRLNTSLRGKTLLIVFATLVGLVGGLYALSRVALLREFSGLEDDFARQSLQQATSALNYEISTLQEVADEYANEDQTVANLQYKNVSGLAAEFSASVFEQARANFVVVLDGENRPLFEQGFDLGTLEPAAVPSGLAAQFQRGSPLVARTSAAKDAAGLLRIPAGTIMVASSPLVGELPANSRSGTLIIGRLLDGDEVNRLGELTRLPIEIQGFDLASNDPGFRAAARSIASGNSSVIDFYGSSELAAYQPVMDLYGRPAAIMRLALPRKIYQQGQTSIVQFLLLLVAAGFVFGAVILYLLEKFVLSPVAALSANVVKIGTSGDLAARLETAGKDELAFLGNSINTMLDDLEKGEIERDHERARLAMMLENVPAVLWTTDAQLMITSAMGAGLSGVGLPSREAPGLPILEFFRTRDPGFPAIAAHRKALAGEPTSFETPWQTRQFQAYVRPLKSADGSVQGVIGVALDVTDRERLVDQLRQSQKMQAVGELAGGVAHDFNNLLMVVKGHAQILYDRLAETPSLRQSVEQVEKAADRAASLTRQLLAFSRKQVLQPRVLDMNEVVAGMIKMFSRVIGENIEMTFVPGSNLGRVKADPGQIEQVLLNLVVNARDAMPNGGRLTIETSNTELDKSYMAKHVIQPGPYVMLTVTDTGCGMDMETQARIFEPFFTTKGPGKGTGLGLATVYGVVKQSGGYIWVYSEVGHGTTFKIYLPLVTEEVERSSADKDKKVTVAGSETVLLVEDEQNVRELVADYLRGAGYQVIEAEDGDHALKVASAHKGPIHILVTDVVMPHMSGPELAAKLTDARQAMKVLFISGYTDDTVFRHGVLEGGVAYLQKPFNLKAISQKIRDVLSGRVPVEVSPGPAE
jgi:signal transduction histidine kinase/sensor domain CHASE-containing protein/ActR/RegA family two-component response regulator